MLRANQGLSGPVSQLASASRGSLPSGSQVFKWGGTSYNQFTFIAGPNIWSPTTGDQTLDRGEGFFIKVADAMLDQGVV